MGGGNGAGLAMTGGPGALRVVVLTCGDIGVEVAQQLRETSGVRDVTLVTAPYRTKARGLRAKLRHVYRMEGWRGLGSALVRRVVRPFRRAARSPLQHAAASLNPAIAQHHVADFHNPECLELLRGLKPDLGVVAGTYILGAEVFTIPRLGCINLHSGKVPEYRGGPPAFWELYNGESEVGITIHKVVGALDAGQVLLQERFPLDPAPPGDPMRYIEAYRRDVLRPNGVRLLCEAVSRIAGGSLQGWDQDPANARTYTSPRHSAIRELRRRSRARRRAQRS
jgi:methionyl-tRNA formyltransferase